MLYITPFTCSETKNVRFFVVMQESFVLNEQCVSNFSLLDYSLCTTVYETVNSVCFSFWFFGVIERMGDFKKLCFSYYSFAQMHLLFK